MAERDGLGTDLQHPESLRLGDRREIGTQRAQQRRFDPRRHDRELLDGLPRRGGQPVHAGQHGVDDGARHRVVRRGESLGDEERVARGGLVEPVGIHGHAGGQFRHGGRGERLQRQPAHGVAAEAAQHTLERVRPGDVVGPVGQQQQRGQVVDAPPDVAQQVQGRAVGPVHVLDGQHRRPVRGGQLLEDGREDLAGVVGGQGGGEGPADVPDRVAERTERARREQVVAGTSEHPARTQRAGERAHQAGLADPGLAGDEDDRSGPVGRAVEGGVEHPQLGVAFEQARRHPIIVPVQRPSTAVSDGTAV